MEHALLLRLRNLLRLLLADAPLLIREDLIQFESRVTSKHPGPQTNPLSLASITSG